MIDSGKDRSGEFAKDLNDLHTQSIQHAIIVPGFRYMVGIGNRRLKVEDFHLFAGIGPVYSEFGHKNIV